MGFLPALGCFVHFLCCPVRRFDGFLKVFTLFILKGFPEDNRAESAIVFITPTRPREVIVGLPAR